MNPIVMYWQVPVQKSADELFRFIHDSRISLPSVDLLTPVPGTALFERMRREGRMLISDEADFLRQNLR